MLGAIVVLVVVVVTIAVELAQAKVVAVQAPGAEPVALGAASSPGAVDATAGGGVAAGLRQVRPALKGQAALLAVGGIAAAVPTKALVAAGVDAAPAAAKEVPVAAGGPLAGHVRDEGPIPAVRLDAVAEAAKAVADPVPVLLHVAALAAAIGAAPRALRGPLPLLLPVLLPVAKMAALTPALGAAGLAGAASGVHDAGAPTALHAATGLPVPAVPEVEARLTAMGTTIVGAAAEVPEVSLLGAPVLAGAGAFPCFDGRGVVAAARAVLVAPVGPIRPRAGEEAPVVRPGNPPGLPALHANGSPQAMDVAIGLRVAPVGLRAAILPLPVAARVPAAPAKEGGPASAELTIRPGVALGDASLAALAARTAPAGLPGAEAVPAAVVGAVAVAPSEGVEGPLAVTFGPPIAVRAILLALKAAPPGAVADGPRQGVGVVLPAALVLPTNAMVALAATTQGPGVPAGRGVAAEARPTAVAAAGVAGLPRGEVVTTPRARAHQSVAYIEAGVIPI